MPIPKPKPGESESDFMGRCMSNPTMVSEYESKQRAAICHQSWDDRSKSAGRYEMSDVVRKDILYMSKGLGMDNLVPSDEHLDMVNQFTRTKKTAEEVFVFPTYAMNDLVDRDLDRFTGKAIRNMFRLPLEQNPIGKGFLYLPGKGMGMGHGGADVKGRIYHGEATKKEGVTWAKLWVYLPNTDQNKNLIENIDFGINWAVSVGVGAANLTCGICGEEMGMFTCANNHFIGDVYEGTVCHREINAIADFYELTQCYLGAQYDASIARASKVFNMGYGFSKEVVDEEDGEVDKGIVPYNAYSIAPEGTSWSFGGSDGNALLGPNGSNWARFKSAHTTFDGSGTPKTKDAYHLPHHKIIGGNIKTVWHGVSAAGAAIMGARGGYQGSDKEGAKGHLDKHYAQFGKTSPWKNEKVIKLVDSAYELSYNEDDGNLVITTWDEVADIEKTWLYDGVDIIEESHVNEEVKEPLENDEKVFAQADVDKFLEDKNKVIDDKESIITWLTAEKEYFTPFVKAGESYIETLKQECLKSFILATAEPDKQEEVDTSFVEKLIATCGKNVELLEMLKDDYQNRAEDKMPDRRSSEEEPIPTDVAKKTAPVDESVDEMHNVGK